MGVTCVVRGADVVDGTGAPPRGLDVVVADDRIALVERGTPVSAEETVDGRGRVLAPGFIDTHTHSDGLALDPDAHPDLALAPVRQGVTVEVVGNCGSTTFPHDGSRSEVDDFVRTLFGRRASAVDGAATFLAAHDHAGRLNHVATLVGHSTLRASVVGFEDRPPDGPELARMCSLLEVALAEGAVGLSTGLIYPPGTYAGTDELVALAEVLAAHDAPYVTHLRDEMSGVEAALDEALTIARRSRAPLHVSHHKTAGVHAHGLARRTLGTMDDARADGLDVTCDVYPYTAGNTHLHAMFPPWANEGGVEALLARARSGPGFRDAVRRSIAEGVPGWENTVGNGGWSRLDVAMAARHPHLQGSSIEQLAGAAGMDPVDLAADLLVAEDAQVVVISRSMEEDDVRRVLAHPGTMVGSDGVPQGGAMHPRWAGSFARVLGRYVREERVLDLPDAVARMTSVPADRFGLAGRGRLRDGAPADLVLLDPDTVTDRATYADPLASPQGIDLVLVDGVPVVRRDEPTGARPGRALRRAVPGPVGVGR